MNLSIITDEILVGTQVAAAEELKTLHNLGVRGLLSLQDDRDLWRSGVQWDALARAGATHGIEMRRVAIVDFDPGDFLDNMERAVGELDDLIHEHGRVYVHCTAGINRSAGVVLSYLVLKRGVSVEAAYRLIKSRRPQSSPYRALIDRLFEHQRRERSGVS